jgi:hypothetical protein
VAETKWATMGAMRQLSPLERCRAIGECFSFKKSLRGGAEGSWGSHQRNSNVSLRLPSRDILHPVDIVIGFDKAG